MKITLNHSRLGTSLLSVLPTKRSWNSLCPFYLKATSLRLRIALGVFLFYICSGAIVTAQVRFVQLTDPHLFDQSEREQNKQIFIDAIWEINKLQAKNGAYDFVVVTGDIGVESIINNEGEGAIDKNAKMIADKMSLSEVKLWLFVPGNNDLVDELPHTI